MLAARAQTSTNTTPGACGPDVETGTNTLDDKRQPPAPRRCDGLRTAGPPTSGTRTRWPATRCSPRGKEANTPKTTPYPRHARMQKPRMNSLVLASKLHGAQRHGRALSWPPRSQSDSLKSPHSTKHPQPRAMAEELRQHAQTHRALHPPRHPHAAEREALHAQDCSCSANSHLHSSACVAVIGCGSHPGNRI